MRSLLSGLKAYWAAAEQSSASPLLDGLGQKDIPVSFGAPAVASVYNAMPSARSFNPATPDIFSTAGDDAYFDPGDIDFSFVVWMHNLSAGADRGVLNKWDTLGNQRGYQLTYIDATQVLHWYVSNNGTAVIDSATAVSGNYPKMVCVYHDSVGDLIGGIVLGPAGEYTQFSIAHATGVFNCTASFRIGNGVGANSLPYDGRLGPIGYWHRLLTTKEVFYLWNQGMGRTFPFFDGRYRHGYRGHYMMLGKHRSRMP